MHYTRTNTVNTPAGGVFFKTSSVSRPGRRRRKSRRRRSKLMTPRVVPPRGRRERGPMWSPRPQSLPRRGLLQRLLPRRGLLQRRGNTTAPTDEEAADQADLATRYPVGKEVYLYARPTESDEALITSQILEPKDYFTPNPPPHLEEDGPPPGRDDLSVRAQR